MNPSHRKSILSHLIGSSINSQNYVKWLVIIETQNLRHPAASPLKRCTTFGSSAKLNFANHSFDSEFLGLHFSSFCCLDFSRGLYISGLIELLKKIRILHLFHDCFIISIYIIIKYHSTIYIYVIKSLFS